MAERTKISWTDHTFNPWGGCSKVNEGCAHCYAEHVMDHRFGRVKWGPQGTRRRTSMGNWRQPLRWDRAAAKAGTKRKVFCASLADVFEDRPKLVPWRNDLFDLIDATPNLYWLLLTKRPENIKKMWKPADSDLFSNQDQYDHPECLYGRYRSNVWLGTSIANQDNADEFVQRLLGCRSMTNVLFLSVEPQIGRISLTPWIELLDWVIVGGESRQGGLVRPFNIDWARLLRRQCQEASVPFFLKQLGTEVFDGRISLPLAGNHNDDLAEWPEDLRVRECPETYELVEA